MVIVAEIKQTLDLFLTFINPLSKTTSDKNMAGAYIGRGSVNCSPSISCTLIV